MTTLLSIILLCGCVTSAWTAEPPLPPWSPTPEQMSAIETNVNTNLPYSVTFANGRAVTNQVKVASALVCRPTTNGIAYEAIEDYMARERAKHPDYVILRLMESNHPESGWLVRNESFYAIEVRDAARFYKLDIEIKKVME